MNPLKVLVIIGTRPEAIKMAPVVRQLENHPERATVTLCSTGQHTEMLHQVLELFKLTPEIDLDLMAENQTLNQVAARVLASLDPLLADLQPDWMLVQGDTTTVMASSLAAQNRRVRVGHVEAGLRSFDRLNPFPEEMNRVVTDHISDLHFAPTKRARTNLLREGIDERNIYVTGNTGIDALMAVANRPLDGSTVSILRENGLEELVNGSRSPIVLVTAHRRENHGQPIHDICQALQELVRRRPQCHVIYPVHRNPNVWQPVHELLGGVSGITFLSPVDYATMVHLMNRSHVILTDSGGVQEEAPTLGVPVLVARDTTERPEAIEAGVARLIGTDCERILAETIGLLDDSSVHALMSEAMNPYGDGRAAERIVTALFEGSCDEFIN